MKIALIQMKVYPGEKDRNIRHAFELLEEAAPRSDIVILPELWSIGYDFHDLKKKATRVGDSLCRNLSELAGNTETVIFAGTLPVAENKKSEIQRLFSITGDIWRLPTVKDIYFTDILNQN